MGYVLCHEPRIEMEEDSLKDTFKTWSSICRERGLGSRDNVQ